MLSSMSRGEVVLAAPVTVPVSVFVDCLPVSTFVSFRGGALAKPSRSEEEEPKVDCCLRPPYTWLIEYIFRLAQVDIFRKSERKSNTHLKPIVRPPPNLVYSVKCTRLHVTHSTLHNKKTHPQHMQMHRCLSSELPPRSGWLCFKVSRRETSALQIGKLRHGYAA